MSFVVTQNVLVIESHVTFAGEFCAMAAALHVRVVHVSRPCADLGWHHMIAAVQWECTHLYTA